MNEIHRSIYRINDPNCSIKRRYLITVTFFTEQKMIWIFIFDMMNKKLLNFFIYCCSRSFGFYFLFTFRGFFFFFFIVFPSFYIHFFSCFKHLFFFFFFILFFSFFFFLFFYFNFI